MQKENPFYRFLKHLFETDYKITINGFKEKYDFQSLPTIMNKLKNDPKKRLHPETIEKIETALNIKIDDTDPENITYIKLERGKIIDSDIQLFNYPIISHISKGLSMETLVKENTIGYVTLPYNKRENCFAFIVQDDSMANKIEQSDIVLADLDVKVSDNDIVIALLKDGRQIIRKYREVAPNIIMLFSDNTAYAPITIPKSDIEACYCVIGTWKNFRKG